MKLPKRTDDGSFTSNVRNVKAEAKALADMVVKDPKNEKLVERAQMARAALKSEVALKTYLAEYPTKDLPRQAKANYRGKRKPAPGKMPSNKAIVLAWQMSHSKEEAAERLGIPEHAAWLGTKIGAMKRHGVKLKTLSQQPRGKRMDVDGLNKLIDTIEEQTDAIDD